MLFFLSHYDFCKIVTILIKYIYRLFGQVNKKESHFSQSLSHLFFCVHFLFCLHVTITLLVTAYSPNHWQVSCCFKQVLKVQCNNIKKVKIILSYCPTIQCTEEAEELGVNKMDYRDTAELEKYY